MNQTDDRILELLEESGLELSPVVIARNLEYSRSWISQRLSKLVEADLVAVDDGSYYRITGKGEKYLSGDLKPEELE